MIELVDDDIIARGFLKEMVSLYSKVQQVISEYVDE